jgi:hypothetical protein
MGIYGAAAILLKGRPVSLVAKWFGPWRDLNDIQQAAFCDWLWVEDTEEGLMLLADLLREGVQEAIFPFLMHVNGREDESFKWPSLLDEVLVDKLIEAMPSNSAGTWATNALAGVCRARGDLLERVKESAARAEGIMQAALLYASGSENSDEFWSSMERVVVGALSTADRGLLHLLNAFTNLSWQNHERLAIMMLRLRDRDLARSLLEPLVLYSLVSHKLQLQGLIEPLDWWWQWMSEDAFSPNGWSFCDRLAAFLVAGMTPSMQEACLETFNTPGCPFRPVLQEHVMRHLSELTSDKLSEDAIDYLIADLAQRDNSFRGSLLGLIATERFVEARLLPLLPLAEEPLRRNLLRVLQTAGGRHRHRYATLEDQKGI